MPEHTGIGACGRLMVSEPPDQGGNGGRKVIIAVDGPAGAGKGTLASDLARHYALPYLDTGLIYRAVARAWAPFARNADAPDKAIALAGALDVSAIDPEGLGSAEIGQLASEVSAIAEVRAALFRHQRDFATRAEGAVLDGRDIGTVICPEADVKLFVTASPEVRMERRARQLELKGETVDRAALLKNIKERDNRDMNRATAPLRPAADAHLLDTSEMDIEAALRAAIAIVDGSIARKSGL